MKLEFKIPGEKSHYYDVKLNSLIVGRSQRCHISLDIDSLSREHLKITRDDEGLIKVTDLGSANGTYLNGNRLTENVPEAFSSLFSFILGNGIEMRILEDTESFPEPDNVIKVSGKKSQRSGQGDSKATFVLDQPKKRIMTPRRRDYSQEEKGKKKSFPPLVKLILLGLIIIISYFYLADSGLI